MLVQSVVSLDVENAAEAKTVLSELAAILQHRKISGQFTPPKAVSENMIVIHTDGGYSGQYNIGSWAFTIQTSEGVISQSGYFQKTTNNRMEMLAVIRALETIEPGQPVVVYSDSEYVIKGITSWIKGWVSRGWKNSYGADVKNRDLWEVLLALSTVHAVMFKHIKGHNGDYFNEQCDTLCTQALAMCRAAISAGKEVETDQ